MLPESTPPNPIRYPAFKLRFRALRIDANIFLAVFLVGGITAGIVFENYAAARAAVLVLMLVAILAYEPFMVSRYGATVGHRRCNIRIVCNDSDENLPVWRAILRSLVKQIFGLPSFVFMFVTSKAQGLHDLFADSRVTISDPTNAIATDYFDPSPPAAGRSATFGRKILAMFAYNIMLLVLLGRVSHLWASPGCLNRDELCTALENWARFLRSVVWLALAALITVLGLTGRLPGCRPGKPVEPIDPEA